jgi:uncharacterized membrane protein YdjX (TVP38/TMEM64 family)
MKADEGRPAGPRGAERNRWSRTARRRLRWVLPLLLLAAWAASGDAVDLELVLKRVRAWPETGAVVLIGVLPLVGVPVSVLHLAAGLRFGFWTALWVVAGTTWFQQVCGWALVRCLPGRFFSGLEPWRQKLAGAGHREAAALSCLIPGMPYTVQLYLLPVMGLSLSTICAICVPLHVIRAVATILLGNLGDELTPGRVAALGAYYLVVLSGCAWLVRRMRSRPAAAQAAGDRAGEARAEEARLG